MASDATQPPADTATPDSSATTPPRRRRRWLLKALVALAVLLILLVALAPRIASTSPFRRMVLGMVNRNLAGKVDIQDWSLSWTGGLSASGISLRQPDGTPFLQIAAVKTRLSLLDAVRGRMRFGSTSVEGLDLRLRSYADGTDSFARFLGAGRPATGEPSAPSPQAPSPAPAGPDSTPAPAPSSPAVAGGARALPAVSGTFYLSGRATVEAHDSPPVHLPAIRAMVDVPAISGPIANALDIELRCGDGRAGRISASGAVKIGADGQFRPDAMDGRQSFELADLDLSALRAFLPAEQVRQLAGIARGSLAVSFAAGKDATASGSLLITDVSFAGAGLAPGEKFSCKSVSLDVPPARLIMSPDGMLRTRLIVGDESGRRLSLKLDQGSAAVFADATVESLLRTVAGQAPGDAGRLGFDASIDVGALAAAMPRTLGVMPGAKVTAGTYRHTVRATLARDRARYSAEVSLAGLAADVPEKGRVTMKDVTLATSADIFGGGGVIPDLRDVKLAMGSAFANADLQAPRLDALRATVEGDLAQLRQELGQIFDLGQMELAGQIKLAITSKGDLAAPGGTARLEIKLTGTGIAVKTAGMQIDEPRLVVQADGVMRRGRDVFIGGIDGLTISAVSGPAAAPAATLLARAGFDTGPAGGGAQPGALALRELELEKLEIDVARALKQFGMRSRDPAKEQTIQSGTVLAARGTIKGRPATVGGGYQAAMELAVPRLRLLSGKKPASWDNPAVVRFDGDIAADAVNIRQLLLDVENGASLRLAVAGRVAMGSDRLAFDNVKGSLSYDADKLLAILRPLIGDVDLSIKGAVKDQPVRLAGHWRTGAPLAEAIRGVDASLALSFDEVQTMGLKMSNVAPELSLSRGVAGIDSRKPISCSGGTVHIDGVRLNLAAESPQLTIRKGPLVNNVELNPIFADMFLGQFSFLFRGVTEARGPLKITIEQFDAVPLAWMMPAPAGSPRQKVAAAGSASVALSLDQGRLGSGLLLDILKAVGANLRVPGAAITDGRIRIADGRISSVMPLLLDKHRFEFSSTIDSATGNITEGEIVVPASATRINTDVRVAVTGHYSAPRPDIAGSIAKSVKSPDVVKLLQGLGGAPGKEPGTVPGVPVPLPIPVPPDRQGKDKEPSKGPSIPGVPGLPIPGIGDEPKDKPVPRPGQTEPAERPAPDRRPATRPAKAPAAPPATLPVPGINVPLPLPRKPAEK